MDVRLPCERLQQAAAGWAGCTHALALMKLHHSILCKPRSQVTALFRGLQIAAKDINEPLGDEEEEFCSAPIHYESSS